MPANTVVRRIETGIAFLTGVECRTPSSSKDQEQLVTHGLVPLTGATSATSRLYFDTDAAEHGTDVVPSAFATAPQDLLDQTLLACGTVQGWTAVHLRIRLHDFGVGTGVVVWEPTDPAPLSLATDEAFVDALRGATETAMRPLLQETMSRLTSCFPDRPKADGVVSLLWSVRDELPTFGEPLWVWTHLRLAVDTDADGHRQVADDVAARICPNDFTLLSHRDHTYATGVSVSITCSRADRFDDGVSLSRILPKQDAWWALLWALDRALLALQKRVDGAVTEGSIAVMVARARQIETVTARVQLLRSRVDSVLVNAGARELAVWQSLGESWHLELRTEVAQRKLQFLQASYQSVLSETSRRRADQISLMVYIFTAVSVIASAIAVVQYAQGTGPAGGIYRATVLLVCVLAAAGAVLSTLRAQRLRAGRGSESTI